MTNVSYSRDAAAGTNKTQTKSAAISAVAWPSLWSRTVSAVSDPDFIAVTIFCAIGLLATVNLMLNGFVIVTL